MEHQSTGEEGDTVETNVTTTGTCGSENDGSSSRGDHQTLQQPAQELQSVEAPGTSDDTNLEGNNAVDVSDFQKENVEQQTSGDSSRSDPTNSSSTGDTTAKDTKHSQEEENDDHKQVQRHKETEDSSEDNDTASTEPPGGEKVGLTFSDDEEGTSTGAVARGYNSDDGLGKNRASAVVASSFGTLSIASPSRLNQATTDRQLFKNVQFRGKFTYLVFKKGNNSKPIRKALSKRSDEWEPTAKPLDSTSSNWTANFIWKPTWRKFRNPPRDFSYDATDRKKRQVVNHLRGVEPLCSKDLLYVALEKYYKAQNKDVKDVVPTTVIVDPRAKVPCEEWMGWKEFEQAFHEYSRKGLHNVWLLKPSSTNRGVGIEIMNKMDKIRSFLETKAGNASMGLNPTWVLQKYIEDPLLVHGRKFDIRVWVAVCDDGNAYIYGPGYIRTSSSIWTLDDLDRDDNRLVHLTNYCAQSKAGNFGIFEKGNTLGFDQFAAFLDSWLENPQASMGAPDGVGSASVPQATVPERGSSGMEILWGDGGIWKEIKDIVSHTMKALRVPSVHATSRSGCSEWGFGHKPVDSAQHRFELLGYDFMLDSKLKPWLIEVNTNPSLTYQNRWHKKLVDQMIDELLQLVVDPVFNESREENGKADTVDQTTGKNHGSNDSSASPKRHSPTRPTEPVSPSRSPTRVSKSYLASTTKDSAAARLAAAKSMGATHLVPEEERAAFGGSEEEEEDPFKTDVDNEDSEDSEDDGKKRNYEIENAPRELHITEDEEEKEVPSKPTLAIFCSPKRNSKGVSYREGWMGWKKVTNIFRSKPVISTQFPKEKQPIHPKKTSYENRSPVTPSIIGVSNAGSQVLGNVHSERKNTEVQGKLYNSSKIPPRSFRKVDSTSSKTEGCWGNNITKTNTQSSKSSTDTKANLPTNTNPTEFQEKTSTSTEGSDKRRIVRPSIKPRNESTTPALRRCFSSSGADSSHEKHKKESRVPTTPKRQLNKRDNVVGELKRSTQKAPARSMDDSEIEQKKWSTRTKCYIKPSWNTRSFQLQQQKQLHMQQRPAMALPIATPDLSLGLSLNDTSTSVGNRMRSSSSNNAMQDALDRMVDQGTSSTGHTKSARNSWHNKESRIPKVETMLTYTSNIHSAVGQTLIGNSTLSSS